jgi:hypothetical protein
MAAFREIVSSKGSSLTPRMDDRRHQPRTNALAAGWRIGMNPSWPRSHRLQTKAEYIGADHLSIRVFRLQFCGGPYMLDIGLTQCPLTQCRSASTIQLCAL